MQLKQIICLVGLCVSSGITHFAGAEDSVPLPPRPLPSSGTSDSTTYSSYPSESSGRLSVRPTVSPQASDSYEYGTKTVLDKDGEVEKPKFVVQTPTRQPATGYYVGAFAGVNFAATTDSLTNPPFASDVDSKPAPTAGIKLGYTWSFDDAPIDQFRDEVGGEGIRVSGSLEVESFYLRSNLEITNATGGKDDFYLDSALFSSNALLNLQFHKIRLYGGPGLGFAYIHGSGYGQSTSPDDNDDAINLLVQGIGGINYFFKHDWAIFGEYKYIYLDDVDLFNGNNSFRAETLQQHLFTIGLRHYY